MPSEHCFFKLLFCKTFYDKFVLGILTKKVFSFKKLKISEFKTGRNHAAGKRITGSIHNGSENAAFWDKYLGLFSPFDIKTEFYSFKLAVFVDDMDNHRNSGMIIPDFVGFKTVEAGNIPILKKKINAGPKFAVSFKRGIHCRCIDNIFGFKTFVIISAFRMFFHVKLFDKIFSGEQMKKPPKK